MSFTVSGFPGYDVDAPLPTLVQILNGEKPANTPPIRVDSVPGSQERYSGGGVVIEQRLMTDVTGKPFAALMRETVLDKLGMTDSTYEQQTQGQLVQDLSERLFSGSAAQLAMHALSMQRTSAEELQQIRKLIERKRKGR